MATGKGSRNKSSSSLAKTIKTINVILGDGNEYQISPLNMNMLENLEEEFGEDFTVILEKSQKPKYIKAIVRALLSPNHSLSIEEVGNLITSHVVSNVAKAIEEAVG